MTARTGLLAGAMAVASLVALTGCTKPTPIVSLVAGGSSVHTEATLYCFGGQTIAQRNCRTDTKRAPTVLKVKPGQQIGIDVSRQLAKSGWVVVLPAAGKGQDESSAAQTGHYLTFVPQFSTAAPQVAVDVRMLDHRDGSKATIGLWRFVLVPK